MDKKAVAKNVLTFLIFFSLILITSFFLSHELNVNSQTFGSVNGINKNYDSLKNSVILTNSVSSVPIANITLNTPIHNSVIRGKDRLVAEFTIDNYVSSSDVFNGLDFYDIKNNMNKFDRTFVYKFKTFENIEVPDYKTTCQERLNVNGTMEKYNCVQTQIGTHTEQKAIWNSFNEKATLPRGSITLGIFTDVLPDESVEWQPTLYGVKIDEWASWNETFTNGLVGYWAFEEANNSKIYYSSVFTQRNVTCDGSPSNGTVSTSCPAYVAVGKTGHALAFNGSGTGLGAWLKSDYYEFGANAANVFAGGFTECVWANSTNAPTGTISSISGYVNLESESDGRYGFHIDGSTRLYTTSTAGGVNYDFICIKYNVTNNVTRFYFNGTDENNYNPSVDWGIGWGEALSIGNTREGNPGAEFDGQLDELMFWNRTLTDAEISSLYNDGAGTFYQDSSQNQTSNTTGYISWDGDFMTFGKINSTSLINTEMGYCVNGEVGITNSTGFWMCKDSACSSTCQVDIRGGIIVGCS